MNEQDQNIAIAEFCGWKYDLSASIDVKRDAVMCWVRPGNSDWQTERIPDYINDLNAMHEAEKELNNEQYMFFIDDLFKMAGFSKL
jgi:hypothetical protein